MVFQGYGATAKQRAKAISYLDAAQEADMVTDSLRALLLEAQLLCPHCGGGYSVRAGPASARARGKYRRGVWGLLNVAGCTSWP